VVKVSRTRRRTQNRRGEGEKLRGDIVAAATELLEETGSEDAITLRGVARQVGITAPSVYGHFDNVDAIVMAVVGDAFEELEVALADALDDQGDTSSAEARLRAVCRAYLDFARESPQRYRVMFRRHRTGPNAMSAPRPAPDLLGGRAFGLLVDAVGGSADPGGLGHAVTDATVLWVAIHGYASLLDAVPAFPWPEPDDLLDTLIQRLVPRRT
jgi:AcrR family transcriptional regulator